MVMLRSFVCCSLKSGLDVSPLFAGDVEIGLLMLSFCVVVCNAHRHSAA